MTYQAAYIQVDRIGEHNYVSHIIYQDDGISPYDINPPFKGPDLQEGPFLGSTHRRAWRKAWKAAGCNLTDQTQE